MQVRKFDVSAGDVVARPGTRGVRATVVQLPGSVAAQMASEDLIKRFHGAPILVSRPTGVVALHFDPGAEIDDHMADEPILFLVIAGSGFVRVSAPGTAATCPGATEACALLCGRGKGDACGHDDCSGESAVSAGDAVLWPAGSSHQAWTTGDSMTAIAVHYGRDA